MVAERRTIELTDSTRLIDVVADVESTHQPIELHRAGKVIAIVSPVESESEEDPPKGSAEAWLKYAGAFADVFTDEVMAALEAQRRVPSRTFDSE